MTSSGWQEYGDRDVADHAADLQGGVDLVPDADRAGAGQQLVVRHLEQDLPRVLAGRQLHTGVGPQEQRVVGVHLVVDLVERHPPPHLVVVTLEADPGKPGEELDQLTVAEAAVVAGQVQRQLEVGQGDHRLNAVGQELVEHRVIEGEPFLVRLGLVAVGEDPRPRDRGAQAGQAEFGEQGDVLAEPVVEVDRLVVGVELPGLDRMVTRRGTPCACGEHVDDAGALAASVPAALELVGCQRAAPQESGRQRSIRHCFHGSSFVTDLGVHRQPAIRRRFKSWVIRIWGFG